jgi:hypothetical protein
MYMITYAYASAPHSQYEHVVHKIESLAPYQYLQNFEVFQKATAFALVFGQILLGSKSLAVLRCPPCWLNAQPRFLVAQTSYL